MFWRLENWNRSGGAYGYQKVSLLSDVGFDWVGYLEAGGS